MVVGGGVAGGDQTRGALAYDPLTGSNFSSKKTLMTVSSSTTTSQ